MQARRKRSDAEIFRLFLRPHWCIEGERGYEELQRGLTQFYGLGELFGPDGERADLGRPYVLTVATLKCNSSAIWPTVFPEAILRRTSNSRSDKLSCAGRPVF